MKKDLSLLYGAVAALFLPAVYLTAVAIFNSFTYALLEFTKVWYWVSLLSIGLGVQIGLFSFIRHAARARTAALTAEVTASGGISTVSMIACCAHYIVAALPFLGLSAAALFMAKYQVSFFIIGIFSNLTGIIIMLMHIQKHRLYRQGGVIERMAGVRLRPALYGLLGLAIIVPLSSFALLNDRANNGTEPMTAEEAYSEEAYPAESKPGSDVSSTSRMPKLESRVDSRNGINIEVSSENFRIDKPIEFSISFSTHVGDMRFDVGQIAYLVDSAGNTYKPIRWEGDPPGGHHRSGRLLFPALKGDTAEIELVMKNIYDIDERTFHWKIQP